MTKRSRIAGFGTAALLVAAGIAGAVAFSGTVGQVIALVLIGMGFVLATSLVFFEVGLSEDRERERARARQRARQERARREPDKQRPRTRLERMRGRRRRLG